MPVNTPDDLVKGQTYFISKPSDQLELLGVYKGKGKWFKNGNFRWENKINNPEQNSEIPWEYSFYNGYKSLTYEFSDLDGVVLTPEEYKSMYEKFNPLSVITLYTKDGVYSGHEYRSKPVSEGYTNSSNPVSEGHTNSPKPDSKGGKFKKSIRRNVKKRRTQQKKYKNIL
jgi:hypothetical protein